MPLPKVNSRYHAVWIGEFFTVVDFDEDEGLATLRYDDGSTEFIDALEWEDSMHTGDIVEVQKS